MSHGGEGLYGQPTPSHYKAKGKRSVPLHLGTLYNRITPFHEPRKLNLYYTYLVLILNGDLMGIPFFRRPPRLLTRGLT